MRTTKTEKQKKLTLEEFYKEHLYSFLKISKRLTKNDEEAHDLVSLSFLKLIPHYEKLNPEKSYRYMKSVIYNTFRNEYRRRVTFPEDVFYDLPTENDPDSKIFYDKVMNEISTLPEKQRKCFYLKYMSDYTYKEIATLTHSKYDTVKANSRIALEKIKSTFDKPL